MVTYYDTNNQLRDDIKQFQFFQQFSRAVPLVLLGFSLQSMWQVSWVVRYIIILSLHPLIVVNSFFLQACAGVFAAVAQILTLAATNSHITNSAIAYFSTGLFIIILCLLSFFIMMRLVCDQTSMSTLIIPIPFYL